LVPSQKGGNSFFKGERKKGIAELGKKMLYRANHPLKEKELRPSKGKWDTKAACILGGKDHGPLRKDCNKHKFLDLNRGMGRGESLFHELRF